MLLTSFNALNKQQKHTLLQIIASTNRVKRAGGVAILPIPAVILLALLRCFEVRLLGVGLAILANLHLAAGELASETQRKIGDAVAAE